MSLINIWDYPPYPFLEQILNHCPKAGSTYLYLWKQRDKSNKVEIPKKEICEKTLSHVSTFKHNLMLLCREGLINIDEDKKNINIEMVGWDVEEFE